MLKNLMDACVGGIVYYIFGWGLAHGGETTNEKGAPDGKTFLGDGQFMLLPHRNIDDYGYHLFFFNYVFAATIATIVSGAVAERIQFRAYMIYSFLLTGFVAESERGSHLELTPRYCAQLRVSYLLALDLES